jgi:hypothetical protein
MRISPRSRTCSPFARPVCFAFVACVALAGGCGDDGGGSGGGGGGGTGGDATGPGGGATGGGGEGGGPAKTYAGYGYVTVTSYALTQSAPSNGYVATAGFSRGSGSSQGYACTTETVDGCTIVDCVASAGGSAGELELLEAGTVSIAGGAQSVTLSPGATKQYGAVTSAQVALFDGGETLGMQASGSADLPAFEGSVVAPTPIDVTSPSFAQGAAIDRTTPLEVTWTGGAAGMVSFSVTTVETSSGQTTATTTLGCEAPASGGSLTVPAAALDRLSPTGPSVTATMAVSVSNRTSLEVADLLVSLIATHSARADATGGQASAVVSVD